MEDNQIVDLYWARSESAIMETASKYEKYCHAIAYNILCDQEDADESVNDTYLGAWNAMPPTVRPSCVLSSAKLPGAYLSRNGGTATGTSVAAAKFPLPLTNFQSVYHQMLWWRMKLWRRSCQKHSIALSPICQLRKGKSFSAATGIWTLSSKSAQTLVLASVK